MSTNSKQTEGQKEIQAGIVVLVSFVLFTGVVIILSKGKVWFNEKMEISVYFSDVMGLKVGDPVQILGMEKGNVKKVRLAEVVPPYSNKKEMRVLVEAEINMAEKFSASTEISIDRSLTGQTVLKIRPGTGGSKEATYVFWGQENSNYMQLAQKGNQVLQRIDQFVGKVGDEGSSRAVVDVIKNMQEVSFVLKDGMPKMNRFLVSVEGLSKILSTVVEEEKGDLIKSIKNFHQVSVDLKSASENAHAIMQNMLEASFDIKSVTKELRWKPWLLFHKPDRQDLIDHGVYNGVRELQESVSKMQKMVEKSGLKNDEEMKKLKHDLQLNAEKLKRFEWQLEIEK